MTHSNLFRRIQKRAKPIARLKKQGQLARTKTNRAIIENEDEDEEGLIYDIDCTKSSEHEHDGSRSSIHDLLYSTQTLSIKTK